MVRTELIQSLDNNIRILADFVRSVPSGRLHITRRDGCWSIYQHVHHLSEVQKVIHLRLGQFLADGPQTIVPINPDKATDSLADISSPLESLLENFAAWRGKQLEIIRSAPDAIWTREIHHPEYEKYSFAIMVRHALLHDAFHMHRIEELWLLRDEYLTDL